MKEYERLACNTCRKRWWQCLSRVKWSILYCYGEILFQCTWHEDIDKFRRIADMRRMLDFVTKRKVELERKLAEEEA